MTTRLDLFSNSDFQRGRTKFTEALWITISTAILSSGLPGNGIRIALLKLFGAKIGKGVVVKPRVRIKFPWRLKVGDHSWIGEDVWIDNLAQVTIGNHVCISQGAYLCTGSHDWKDKKFSLITKPITIEHGAWIGAMSRVAPGVKIEDGAVLTIGSTAVHDLDAQSIWARKPSNSEASSQLARLYLRSRSGKIEIRI